VAEQTKAVRVQVDSLGVIWFIGWLFTWAYANLMWWQVLLGLVAWPFYLGVAAR
jgi:hypothetical protein